MQYEHTQKAPLHLALHAIALLLIWPAWTERAQTASALFILGGASVFLILALSFRQLTVTGEADCLALVFGPLPIFRKRIPYAAITAVEPARSSLIDGWGIHYVPGRGWTYNLWGFDCVELHLGKKVVRVGSDDVERLVDFLRGKAENIK